MIVPVMRMVLLVSLLLSSSVQAQTVFQNSPAPSAQGSGSQKDPRSRAKIHTELGALYYQEGQMPIAMEELTIAIAIDSTYAPAWTMRALVHNYLKEPHHAEDNFREAFRLTPDDPELFNNYGWFLCQNGKAKEGISYLLRAVKAPLYQTPDRAYLNAGQCAVRIGDYKAAEEYLDKASRLSGGSPIISLRQADMNFRRGYYDLAKEQLGELIRQVEPNAEVLWLATRIERKVGDRAAENNFATQLRRKFPKSKEYEELLKGNYE